MGAASRRASSSPVFILLRHFKTEPFVVQGVWDRRHLMLSSSPVFELHKHLIQAFMYVRPLFFSTPHLPALFVSCYGVRGCAAARRSPRLRHL